MNNFNYQNPTKILFGGGKISEIANEIPKNAIILITYGGGSIKRNGVYDQVIKALEGYKLLEFGGIEPNPLYETLMRAVDVVRSQKVDFLLSVGGGSVLDGTKFIAVAAHFDGDPWAILSDGAKAPITRAVPLASILTLPATGSEMNANSVISRKATCEKLAFSNPLVYPRFSVLDPTTTYSLPTSQIANGAVDAFVHVTEQYLTFPSHAPIQDRWAEGVLLTLTEVGPQALANPMSYDIRASLMWACTVALNGIIGVGVPQDWATHVIGHELTAHFGLDHAVTLAIVLPRLLQETREEKRAKLLQYGERVWGISVGSEDRRVDEAIGKTEAFFRSVGIKTRLSEHGVSAKDLKPITERFNKRNWAMGENQTLTPDRVERILMASV